MSCAKRHYYRRLKTQLLYIKISFPENFNTNFKGNEIKLVFDENVKLKNLNKQLVISPPMKYRPIISPTSATKSISIKIKDTLQLTQRIVSTLAKALPTITKETPSISSNMCFPPGPYRLVGSWRIKMPTT
jgi:hypothetical protein